jgi:hypothetical protein
MRLRERALRAWFTFWQISRLLMNMSNTRANRTESINLDPAELAFDAAC